jgi:hypothetical protein
LVWLNWMPWQQFMSLAIVPANCGFRFAGGGCSIGAAHFRAILGCWPLSCCSTNNPAVPTAAAACRRRLRLWRPQMFAPSWAVACCHKPCHSNLAVSAA